MQPPIARPRNQTFLRMFLQVWWYHFSTVQKTEHFYQILKFPALFLNVLKVQFIFVVQCLIYFGVLFVKYPGGILYNNSINGVASMVAGVALLILFSSKYRFRRQILIFQYFVAGVLAIALAFLSKYHPERYLTFKISFWDSNNTNFF